MSESREESMSTTTTTTSPNNETLLFQRLGGEAVVCAAVEEMYKRILSDRDMSPFLDGVSMDVMKQHQRDFLKICFTQQQQQVHPKFDLGDFLLTKHEKLFDMGLSEVHVDKFLLHLQQTLESLQTKQHLVAEAVAVIAKFRPVFIRGAEASLRRMETTKVTKLQNVLSEHLDNEELADVFLEANDGGRVPSCRYLLAVRSPVFSRMLFGHFKERDMSVVPLDYQTRTLQALVEYCHTDDIASFKRPLDDNENGVRLAVHLVRAAHYFEMPGLCRIAHDFACSLMNQQPLLASTVLEETETEPMITTELQSKAQELQQSQHQDLLLYRMGGDAVLTAAVEEFYVRTLMDESLERFFQGVDLKVLKSHQVKFMTMVLSGRMPQMDLENVLFAHHYRLFQMGLNEEHFDAMVGHLVASLEAIHVAKPLVEEAYATIAPLRTVFEKGAARA